MLNKCVWAILLAVPVCVYGQTGTLQASHEAPLLRSADMPTYPPIAKVAWITGQVTMQVHVETGKVTGTELLSAELREHGRILASGASQLLTTPTVENLKTWRFDPSVNDVFVVHYTYGIAGTATENPTNPSVEIFPSLDVKITARPVKPTVNY
jgi:hypothetical protein